MGRIDPAAYFAAATRLIKASNDIDTALRGLDGNLDVVRSAGVHGAGVLWSTSYDQSASDVFELASFCAMAARELGYQVHQLGLNHAHAESANDPAQAGYTPPPRPQGSFLVDALHPKQVSAGGTGDRPAHWDLIADRLKGDGHQKWPDCAFTRISAAGDHFQTFGDTAVTAATSVYNDVKTALEEQTEADADGIREDLVWLATAYQDTGNLAKALKPACTEVATKSDTERQQVQAILNSLKVALAAIEVAEAAPGVGQLAKMGFEADREALLGQAVSDFDTLMVELTGFVAAAIKSNTGVYTTASASAALLQPIIERKPRQTDPTNNRFGDDNNEAAGRRGEDRAGVPRGPKEDIVVDGRERTPDYIDHTNAQVTEVKNKNQLDKNDTDQIKDYVKYSNDKGYSTILVVDHRTKLTPDVQNLVDEGKLTLIRKELDDGNES